MLHAWGHKQGIYGLMGLLMEFWKRKWHQTFMVEAGGRCVSVLGESFVGNRIDGQNVGSDGDVICTSVYSPAFDYSQFQRDVCGNFCGIPAESYVIKSSDFGVEFASNLASNLHRLSRNETLRSRVSDVVAIHTRYDVLARIHYLDRSQRDPSTIHDDDGQSSVAWEDQTGANDTEMIMTFKIPVGGQSGPSWDAQRLVPSTVPYKWSLAAS